MYKTTFFKVEVIKYTVETDRQIFRYEQVFDVEYDGKTDRVYSHKDFNRYKDACNFYLDKKVIYHDKGSYKEGVQNFVRLVFYVVYPEYPCYTCDIIEKWDNL